MVAHWGHTDSGDVVAQPVPAQGLETNRLVLVLGVSAAGVTGIAILVAYFAVGACVRRAVVAKGNVDLHSNLRLGPKWIKVALRMRLAHRSVLIWVPNFLKRCQAKAA